MKGHIEIIRESSDCELSLAYVDAQHNLFTDSSMVRKDLLKKFGGGRSLLEKIFCILVTLDGAAIHSCWTLSWKCV